MSPAQPKVPAKADAKPAAKVAAPVPTTAAGAGAKAAAGKPADKATAKNAVAPKAGAVAKKAPRKRRVIPRVSSKATVRAGDKPAPKVFDEGRLAQVLVEPIISEKATHVAEKHNQVLFKVLRSATKPEIKAAVERMFKVEVAAVRVVNQKGKEKRFGRSIGRRDHVRKAYVSLKAGHELNFSSEAA